LEVKVSDSQHDRTERQRRTIVGGRPRGYRQERGSIPRGIEVLLKKASVDPAFCQLLLEKRAEAASEIELELSAAERTILEVVPEAQLAAMIENTRVPEMQRRAFLGGIGAVMLAALAAGCEPPTVRIEGIQPGGKNDTTPTPYVVEKGIRPDWTVPVKSSPAREDTPTAPPAPEGTTPGLGEEDTPTSGDLVRGIRPDGP
jgi:hypothetical protein